MEVLTPKTTRRSTRLRVEIPLNVTSLDRTRPFAEKCVAVIVSAQGCGFRSSRALQMGTPVLLSDLPGGVSVSARVASCLPLGSDGKYFLVGVSLYTHGNVWGVADPPEDWELASQGAPVAQVPSAQPAAQKPAARAKNWPYNLVSTSTQAHRNKK